MSLTAKIISSFDYFDNKEITQVTPIKVGLCNQNYRVDYQGGSILFRVFGEEATESRRHFEFAAQQAANRLAIAPKPLIHYVASNTPLAFNSWCQRGDKPNNGVMISEYFDGQRWSDITPLTDNLLITLAQQLISIHQLELVAPLAEHQDGAEILDHYWQGFGDKNQADFQRYQQVLKAISALELVDDSVIHRDLNATNLLKDSQHQVIIDWEFCSRGDRYIDLATVIVELKLDAHQRELLVTHYNRHSVDTLLSLDKLQCCKIYYLALCWLWQPNMFSGQALVNYRQAYREQLDQLLLAII